MGNACYCSYVVSYSLLRFYVGIVKSYSYLGNKRNTGQWLFLATFHELAVDCYELWWLCWDFILGFWFSNLCCWCLKEFSPIRRWQLFLFWLWILLFFLFFIIFLQVNLLFFVTINLNYFYLFLDFNLRNLLFGL